ncbi:MAG: hypothetical protein FJY73_11360 [Candidatus Eisenbacteria bacterium]|nr:hypothetical protein [Candidatus Eisenbacteria bacterium]
MILLWLLLLAAVYVLIAIVVGKVCAINSRWERTVDGIDPTDCPDNSPSREGFVRSLEGEESRRAGP